MEAVQGQGNRTRIGWVSRPQKEWGSRAALNEEEVVHAIGQRYDADVRVLKFISGQGELAKAIVATHQLDILMGIHGAGDQPRVLLGGVLLAPIYFQIMPVMQF